MKTIEDYTICYDPIPTEGLATLTSSEREEYDRLYEKGLINPKEMLPSIIEFSKKHPHLPEIQNLLAVIYLYLKQIDKVEALIKESYETFPNYLFARINYADQCLRKKKPELIPQIFNHTFNLKALYPSKKQFHVSEFRGFMVFMGFYHLVLKQKDAAERYYRLAKEAEADHPSIMALHKKLYKTSLIKKIAQRLSLKRRSR
jgi:tetratricopeptide (TPR) repeat protein